MLSFATKSVHFIVQLKTFPWIFSHKNSGLANMWVFKRRLKVDPYCVFNNFEIKHSGPVSEFMIQFICVKQYVLAWLF